MPDMPEQNSEFHSSASNGDESGNLPDLSRVRLSLLPSILRVLTVLSFPAIITDVFKLWARGSEPILIFHLAAWFALGILTVNHKRFGYALSAGFLVFLSYALSFVGIYRFGLMGASTFGMLGGGIMAAIFFGTRAAAAFATLAVLTIVAFGLASHHGYIHYDTDYADYISRLGPWLATATVYLLYLVIAIVGFMLLINAVGRSLGEQKRQTEELRRLNEELSSGINEREQAMKLLRENEEKFRVITSSALDAVIMLDEVGKVVLWNPAAERIFGYTSEEMLGREVHPVIAPIQYHRAIQRGFENFVQTGEGTAIGKVLEVSARHRDGHEFPVEIAVSSIKMQGKFWSTAIIRNIEERKKAEEEREHLQLQLRQAAKMEAVGRLAGGVAHDFNNLLTSISGNAAMILMDENEKQSYTETIKEIQKAADSAAQLTRQLLSFSRRQIVEPEVIDINGHIRNMQGMLVRMIGEDVVLEMNPGPEIRAVKIDGGQLDQIVMNLVVNARDAVASGGRIAISTDNLEIDAGRIPQDSSAQPGPHVLICVKDNGVGMDEKTMSHIFEPFFTTKCDGKGTGLGLATVYGAVQQSGGFIEVKSAPGEGSEFRVFLPEAVESAVCAVQHENKQDVVKGSETVLLVEDEQMVRELALRLLCRWGYNVLHAANGQDAIELAGNYKGNIDLLMTDVVMPGINGRQLAEKLALLRPGLKVLFTSGYTEDVIAHSGVIEEGLYFIGKPYTPAALSQKIREALEGNAFML